MAEGGAAVVAATLNDTELRNAINALAQAVDKQTKSMAESFDAAITKMTTSLGKFVEGLNKSGGATQRMVADNQKAAESVNQFTNSLAKLNNEINKAASRSTTTSKSGAAKQVVEMTEAMQKTPTSQIIFEAVNREIDKTKQKLEEANLWIKEYIAAINRGDPSVMSMGMGGIEQAQAEAERLMQTLQRLENVKQQFLKLDRPNENFANMISMDLSKANPELDALNKRFREGTSLLSQQSGVARSVSEEVRKMNQNVPSPDTKHFEYYEKLQKKIRDAGIEAQTTYQKIVRAMRYQLDIGSESPILGVRELEKEIKKMQAAYWGLDVSERKSPLGQSLERDIATANTALKAVLDYNARLSGIIRKNGSDVDKTIGSYESLKNTLSDLQRQYQLLGREERNSTKGKELLTQINQVKTAMREVQSTMNRPVNLRQALGISEKSLDDIAYKIRQLQSYRSGLNLQTQQGEIQQVNAELTRLQQRQRELMSSNDQLARSNDNVTKTFDYIKRRLIYLASIGGATNFVKNLIEVRGQYELTERALGVLVDSAQRGSEIFRELSDMALVSPYTLIELSNAARQLSAYGVAAKDIVDTTRRLADVAAAVGAPIQNIAYALGHVQSYGYLTSLQARQFANNGIPLVKALSEHYTALEGKLVSVSDVYARMKKKQVEYADVMQVVNEMTDEGGRFFDFQAKTADTLKVQLANLTLAWNNMLNDIGKSNKGLLEAPIKGLKELFLHWQEISRAITGVVVLLGAYKASQLIVAVTTKTTTAAIERQILTDKKDIASKLRKKALLFELTAEEKLLLATTRQITSADYQRALATKNLTQAQAGLLVAFNRSNIVLKKAIIQMGLLTAAEMRQITVAKVLKTTFTLTFGAIGQGLATLGRMIAGNWVLLVIGALVDLAMHFSQVNEKQREFNKSVSDGAKETAKSMAELRKTYASGEETNTSKLWETIREEIINSAAAGDMFVSLLESIEPLSKRVSLAIDWSKRIEDANNALSDLYDELEVNQDTWLWGLFGEGLEEDLEDYVEAFKKARKEMESGAITTDNQFWAKVDYTNDLKEAQEEIKKFAEQTREVLQDRLGEGFFDPIKVREALEQVKKQVEAANPKIRGVAKELFDLELDKYFNPYTSGAIQVTDTMMKEIMRRVKRDSSSLFSQLTDATEDLSSQQMRAIEKAANGYREELPPAFRDSLDKMMADMNSRDWLIRVKVQFDVKSLTDVQKQEQKDFIYRGAPNEEEVKKRTQTYMPWLQKTDESDVDHEKRLADAKKKTVKELDREKNIRNQITDQESAYYKQANETVEQLQSQLSVIDEIAKHRGYDLTEEKKKKGGGRGRKVEDELAKALKEEIQLINQMRGNYSKLRKVGYDAITSLEVASSGYENTLKRINSILGKFGVAQFSASDFVGKDAQDPNTLLDFLKKQLNSLKGNKNVKTASLKDLEVEIGKLDIDVKEYNMKKVTEGLQKELTKVKDEYELAVELETNPELADIFTNMFGIDTSAMSSKIEDVVNKYNELVRDAILSDPNTSNMSWFDMDEIKNNFDLLTFDLTEWANRTGVEIGDGLIKAIEEKQKELRNMVKKYEQDLVKQTKDLEYKLADRNGKIIIEEKKLTLLRERLAKETREKEKHLLELQVQDQINVIERLKEEILSELPTYKALFNSIVEHSDMVTRRLAKNYIKMLQDAKDRGLNDRGMFEVIDPTNGKKTELKPEKLFKEEDKGYEQLRKSSTIFAKIKESFKKGEDGIIDWAKGLEYVNELAQQCGGAFHDVANILSEMGADAGLVDVVNALGDTMEGLGTAMQGVSQIASGDYIGGAMSVVKGLWQTVSSWFDVKDKKIQRQIEESEKRVKELERTYAKLEHEINKALGAEEIKAEKAAIANKKAQLAELQRQLQLEKSRSKKKQDADKIDSLQDEIQSLQFEIEDAVEDITNNLLGSNIKNAAEDFVNTWVSAWKEGGDVMDALNGKFDDMIENMIMKSIASKVVAKKLQPIWDIIDQITGEENDALMLQTLSRIKNFVQNGNFAESISTALKYIYEYLGIGYGSGNNKELSALQQGIQGITEDQASALEAYWNANTQQQYVQSDLLTQIRDAVVGMNPDVNLATSAEILLQLQQSYQIQSTIQSMLAGWSNPSGSAVKVELIS